MNEAVKIAVSNESLSILDLILQASLLVQLVMLMLQRRQRQPRVQTAPAEQIPALFTA